MYLPVEGTPAPDCCSPGVCQRCKRGVYDLALDVLLLSTPFLAPYGAQLRVTIEQRYVRPCNDNIALACYHDTCQEINPGRDKGRIEPYKSTHPSFCKSPVDCDVARTGVLQVEHAERNNKAATLLTRIYVGYVDPRLGTMREGTYSVNAAPNRWTMGPPKTHVYQCR